MKCINPYTAEKVYLHSKKAFGIFTLALLLFTSFLILNQNAEAQPFAYVTNGGSNNVSVIDTATNMVITTIAVGVLPRGVAITPDGTTAYVANFASDNVSVINTATNMVIATIPIPVGGDSPSWCGHNTGRYNRVCF